MSLPQEPPDERTGRKGPSRGPVSLVDFREKKKAKGGKPADQPHTPFILVEKLDGFKLGEEYDEDGKRWEWIKIYKLPNYLMTNIKRLLDGSHSEEAALNVLVEYGLRQFDSTGYVALFHNLAASLVNSQDYDEEDDLHDIEAFVKDFRFNPSDQSTGTIIRPFRIKTDLKRQVNEVAKKIGISPSVLLQVFIMDGLIVQERSTYKEHMESQVDTFYYRLRKRTRRLAAWSTVLDLELCKEVKKALASIEETDLKIGLAS